MGALRRVGAGEADATAGSCVGRRHEDRNRVDGFLGRHRLHANSLIFSDSFQFGKELGRGLKAVGGQLRQHFHHQAFEQIRNG